MDFCSHYVAEELHCISSLLSTDLVSVGSYRTNISMTDFENVRQYGAKDNVCMEDANETQLGTMDGKTLV